MNPTDQSTATDREQTGARAGVSRRRVLVAGVGMGVATLAGCAGEAGPSGGESPTAAEDGSDGGTDGSTSSAGRFRLLISDQPVAIDEFDALNVSFDRARIFRGSGEAETEDEAPETESPAETAGGDGTAPATNGSTDATATAEAADEDEAGFSILDLDGATVDLTQVVGAKAVRVFDGELPTGRYTKVELHAAAVEGIVDGERADVKIPSGKLQIVKPFEVVAGETLSFVFDINVVRKGQGGYNLLPVISESGVAGADVEVEEVDRAGEGGPTANASAGTGDADPDDGGTDDGGGPPEQAGGSPSESGAP